MEETEHVGYVTCEVEVVLACTDMRGGGEDPGHVRPVETLVII